MRKLLFAYISFIGVGVLHAQGDEFYGNSSSNSYQQTELLTNPTVQAPNVAAFQKVNFVPVSNYTGRAQISIPIFTIKSGNITVPISLTYNSGGVKVNDIPSSVGSNWALNAGGVVSKIVKGMEDFEPPKDCFFYDFDEYCTDSGYLSTGGTGEPWGEGDPFPDLFIVSAPNLNTQYVHKSRSETLELTGQKNKITETFAQFTTGSYLVRRQVPESNDEEYFDGPFSSTTKLNGIKDIKISSTNGLVYDFKHKDISQYNYTEQTRKGSSGIPFNPIDVFSQFKVESYHLSKIKDQKSNKEVNFVYQTYRRANYDPIDNGYFYTGNTSEFYMDGIVKGKSTKYPILNRLTKINYEGGSVEFVYGLSRQDLTEDKALTQVVIKDFNGVIIKKVNLQYGYMINNAYPNSVQNKRLRLDKVYTTNTQNQALPGYVLTYNTTALPPRGAWGKDFLGYHNGSHNKTVTNPKPKIYFYPNKEMESFLPQSIGGSHYLINGQYSLASHLTYAKAGILEKIQYPTGGFSELEYELNQFKIQNTTISGGGLRIKTQKIKEEDGSEQILDYQYKQTDNSSSGAIVALPNYVDFRVNRTYSSTITPSSALTYFSFKTFRAPQTQAEFTNNSFVGYDRVVVKNRINNGYTEYKYTSPKNFGDIMHQDRTGIISNTITSHPLGTKQYIAKRNGLRSSTYSKEVYRGKLLVKVIYNKADIKLKETSNLYSYKKLSEFRKGNQLRLSGDNKHYQRQNYDGPSIYEDIKFTSERYLLTRSITKDYLEGGITSITKEITHDPTYPLVTQTKITDPTKTVINKFYYPHNSQVSTQPYIGSLRSQNRFSEMIKQEAYQDGTKIFTENIGYANFGNHLFLPKEIKTAKGKLALETGAIITKRDVNGNILEYRTEDDIYTSFVYGYNNTQLVAKIDNATYNTAISKLPITINQLQFLNKKTDENTLISHFNTLRNTLPNARVTSYTYIPSIGISSITDNRARTIYYQYDSFNRLQLVKDHQGNVLTKHQYNYKNQ